MPASVAMGADGRFAAITSPRGGRVHRFDTESGACHVVRRSDVCGLAPAEKGFTATDGLGGVLRVTDGAEPLAAHEGLAWDNHLVPIHL